MNKKTRKLVKYWQKYWPQLQSATDDCEEKLDGKIFTVSTGGIGLLLGTMGVGHEALNKGWIFASISMVTFTVALTLNLIYYKKTKSQQNIQSNEIKRFIENPQNDDSHLHKMIAKDNEIMDCYSTWAVIFLLLGIISFGVYITLNVIK